MSSEVLKPNWLTANLKTVAARRFAEFCQQQLAEPLQKSHPERALYQEAICLVLERLEQPLPTTTTGGRA